MRCAATDSVGLLAATSRNARHVLEALGVDYLRPDCSVEDAAAMAGLPASSVIHRLEKVPEGPRVLAGTARDTIERVRACRFRAITALLKASAGGDGGGAQEAIFPRLIALLIRHFRAEDDVVFPAILADGGGRTSLRRDVASLVVENDRIDGLLHELQQSADREDARQRIEEMAARMRELMNIENCVLVPHALQLT